MASVLNLVSGSIPGSGFGARDRDDLIDRLDGDHQKIDAWVGLATGSAFYEQLGPIASGSVLDMNIGGSDQAAGVLGVTFNRQVDRVIREVVALVAASGSNPTAVVRLDVQVQQGPAQPSNFSSIFNGNANKLAISGSSGFIAKAGSSNFISGSNMVWPVGTALRAVADLTSGVQTGLGAMRALSVQVFWVPSGSYGV